MLIYNAPLYFVLRLILLYGTKLRGRYNNEGVRIFAKLHNLERFSLLEGVNVNSLLLFP